VRHLTWRTELIPEYIMVPAQPNKAGDKQCFQQLKSWR